MLEVPSSNPAMGINHCGESVCPKGLESMDNGVDPRLANAIIWVNFLKQKIINHVSQWPSVSLFCAVMSSKWSCRLFNIKDGSVTWRGLQLKCAGV